MRLKSLLFLVLSAFLSIESSSAVDSTDPLVRATLVNRIDVGFSLLNRLYWSPTLNIWLDRPGDDLRAHYEGRLNPPWWSSANAVETLLDFLKVGGGADYEKQIVA